jgi:hypothetical protein
MRPAVKLALNGSHIQTSRDQGTSKTEIEKKGIIKSSSTI